MDNLPVFPPEIADAVFSDIGPSRPKRQADMPRLATCEFLIDSSLGWMLLMFFLVLRMGLSNAFVAFAIHSVRVVSMDP